MNDSVAQEIEGIIKSVYAMEDQPLKTPPPATAQDALALWVREGRSLFRAKLSSLRNRPATRSEYWSPAPSIAFPYFRKNRELRLAYDETSEKLIWADIYTHWQHTMESLAESLESLRPDSALEMGCGYGRNLIALANRLARVKVWKGLDASANGLIAARINQQLENIQTPVELICSDFKNSRLPDRSVDVVFSYWSLPYGCTTKEDFLKILSELSRIANKGVVLVEPDFSVGFWGLKRGFGFWNFDECQAWFQKQGWNVNVTNEPVRINPLVQLKKMVARRI